MKTWPETLVLEAGLALEVCKHQAPTYLEQAADKVSKRLNAWAKAWDAAHPEVIPCSGDLTCAKTGPGRHKASCPSTKGWKCPCDWCQQGVPFTSILHRKGCTGPLQC
jgi:hypothetical protein